MHISVTSVILSMAPAQVKSHWAAPLEHQASSSTVREDRFNVERQLVNGWESPKKTSENHVLLRFSMRAV